MAAQFGVPNEIIIKKEGGIEKIQAIYQLWSDNLGKIIQTQRTIVKKYPQLSFEIEGTKFKSVTLVELQDTFYSKDSLNSMDFHSYSPSRKGRQEPEPRSDEKIRSE